ncbi:MAG: septal ring lytic transglycosylase RlpA family protein [Patescibacteria group bacterium]
MKINTYKIAAWVVIILGGGFLLFGYLFFKTEKEEPAGILQPKKEFRQSVKEIIAPVGKVFVAPQRGEEKKTEPTSSAPTTKHVIRRGETIEGLAKRYGVLPWQLRATNGMEAKDTLLRPGQSLAIPNVDWKSRAYTGSASWYGPGFHGKRRADTTVYDQDEILVAHRTLPLGSTVRITNLHNGRMIVAKVLDRGPYTKGPDGKYLREIDLSRGAAEALGAIKPGVIPVKIEPFG